MNIFSKENRSIAAAAAKVMQEQPAKPKEQPAPIKSDMVDRVAATNMGTIFKAQIKESTKVPMSKKKTPEDLKTAATTADDGKIQEGNLEALQSDYAEKMAAPIHTTNTKKEKKVK